MKRFVRCACLFLVIVSVMTMPALAAEAADQRASMFFGSSSAYFNVLSGSKFEIWFDVTATGLMDELGASKIELERSSDGVNWSPVKTFYSSDYPQLLDPDDTSFTYSGYVTHTYSSGYYYCATVTLYAKQGNGTASATVTTDILDLT